MTHTVSLRVPVRKLAAMDRRAADVGLDRTGYLLRLVESDIRGTPTAQKRRTFKSTHLLGRFKSSGSSNAKVRVALKANANENR